MEGRGLVLGWGPRSSKDSPFLERLWPAMLAGAACGRGLLVDSTVLDTMLDGCARDCLSSRRRRKELAAALTVMVETDEDPPAASSALLEAALEYHAARLADNGGVCRLGKFHNILYVAAAVAVEQAVVDSAMVGRLLAALHACEGGLDRLVAPAVLGPRVSRLLSSWRSDDDTPEEARLRLVFFLDHARQVRLTLPQPGAPALPVLTAPLPTLQGAPPLYAAVQAGDEEAVLLLLQHGAPPATGGALCPLLLALRRLSALARACMGQRDPCSCSHDLCPCFFSFPLIFPPQEVGVLRLLLRAVGGRCIPADPTVIHPRVVSDGLLGTTPRLAHWARYRLRATLAANWALPHGTTKLPVPSAVLPYLNLLLD
ncbi:uncharacterized protein LOC135105269 [Scylla paramamosain]|uniref:uncharacterized protein LOC135105269 n=1 Tax=Scylla paramamosain TaxID=85552 RepID=UPI00308307D3